MGWGCCELSDCQSAWSGDRDDELGIVDSLALVKASRREVSVCWSYSQLLHVRRSEWDESVAASGVVVQLEFWRFSDGLQLRCQRAH